MQSGEGGVNLQDEQLTGGLFFYLLVTSTCLFRKKMISVSTLSALNTFKGLAFLLRYHPKQVIQNNCSLLRLKKKN